MVAIVVNPDADRFAPLSLGGIGAGGHNSHFTTDGLLRNSERWEEPQGCNRQRGMLLVRKALY